jgi:hypothetical protein
MKERFLLKVSAALGVFCILSLVSSFSLKAAGSTEPGSDSVIARVLEFNVPPEINRPDQKTVSIDMILTDRDTLTLAEEAYVTLVLRDGAISRFEGPARISLTSTQSHHEGSVLVKLTSAILDLFFTRSNAQEEAYLGVRNPMLAQVRPLRIPRALYPPPGCNLITSPRQLRWQPVEGILSYTVSLLDSHQLLWQGKSNSAAIELPLADSLVQSGMTYLWVVEAQVGDRTFLSEQAMFSVLDETTVTELNQNLLEIDRSIVDPKLLHLLRARLYRNLNLKLECYGEVQSLLKMFPADYTASIINAELLEEMGLFKEAVEAYRTIVHR